MAKKDNRPNLKGKLIYQDPKNNLTPKLQTCPNCTDGKINNVWCDACGGVGKRRF